MTRIFIKPFTHPNYHINKRPITRTRGNISKIARVHQPTLNGNLLVPFYYAFVENTPLKPNIHIKYNTDNIPESTIILILYGTRYRLHYFPRHRSIGEN